MASDLRLCGGCNDYKGGSTVRDVEANTTTEGEIHMEASTVKIMGIVREVLADYIAAVPDVKVPKPYREGIDTDRSRKVDVTSETAAECAEWMLKAREWATVAAVFKDSARKALFRQHSLRIANEFSAVAGLEPAVPASAKKSKGSEGEGRRMELPSVVIEDLENGDEVTVVRHITRWGLDQYESFPARIKGRAGNGDYWVTSLADGTSRACRTNEVIVTKRGKVAA